jgi:aldehyde dehydrogenase (NAD+)
MNLLGRAGPQREASPDSLPPVVGETRPEPTGPEVMGVASAVAALRATFDAGLTRPIGWRLERLGALRAGLLERESDLLDALQSDLGKPPGESVVTDLGVVVAEIDHVRKHLERWLRPRRVAVPATQFPARASVVREPLGVVLVVAPWNYPAYLTLMPTIAALAAGNCVLAKPSELAPATASVLAELLGGDGSGTAAVLGGAELVHEALDAGVDHCFFTGSTRVGRLVAEAAGRRLVPVTLELGGKCPAYVDASADLRVAARRIAWAKFVNAGQTCVAPDYVLVDQPIAEAFLVELTSAVRALYGDGARPSKDYARIVDERHLDRLVALLADHGGELVLGGAHDRASRYLAPTVVRDPSPTSGLVNEEIFGPILPVLTVDGPREALEVVQARPDPLAVYVFASDAAATAAIRGGTRSGAFCVNVAMTQLSVGSLPFGGVGASGSGTSHGRYGVEALTQARAIMVRRARPDVALHTPPYSAAKSWLVRRALGLSGRPPSPNRSRR